MSVSSSAVFTLDETLDFGGTVDVSATPTTFAYYGKLSFGGKLETYPLITDNTPTNATTDVDMYPVLNITVEHNAGENFNVSWSTNYSSWTAYNSSCTAGYFTQRATFVNLSESRFYWTVKVNDTHGKWCNRTFYFTTRSYNWTNWSDTWEFDFTGGIPQITNVSPSDGNESVSPGSVTLSALFNDSDGNEMNISWYYADNDTLIGSNSSVSNGTYRQVITVGYQETINWSINVNDSVNWNNQTYTFTVIDLNPVTDLLASRYNATGINLTWTKNSNVTTSYIRYKKDSVPTSITDGIFLENTTNTSSNHSDLDLGTHYYYAVWSYNGTYAVYSNEFTTDDNYTNPGSPLSLQDTDSNSTTITLLWDVGTNATRSVVFQNASGVAQYPDNITGTEVINTTSNTGTVTGLDSNTTYYFSVYSYNPDSGLWSEANSTDYANTTTTAGDIYNLVASRYNDVQINLSWSKNNTDDDTVLVRKTGSYPSSPTDGTEIYNGSLLTYKDVQLTPATKYYYRAWAWDGEGFGSGYDSDTQTTRPSPPTDFVGNIDSGSLIITWVKGTGASRTHIRNNTGSYPANTSDGDLVYNSTGTTTTVSGTSSVDYYRGWSYVVVGGKSIFSLPADLLWGGLEINVYKEDEPWIEIGNYTVFVTNSDATETYQNSSQNNPFRIDVSDVPNGEDITIQVSKDGYKTRSQIMDLYENAYYTVDFYLPASSEGSPSGESGEPWYVNESDSDNETFAYQYIILVQDTFTQPIEDALIVIKRYINTTDQYETIYSDLTDSSGQIEVYLIPDVIYFINITADGYVTKTDSWSPTEIEYYENVVKKYYLTSEETSDTVATDIAYEIQPENFDHYTNISFYFNISSTLDDFEWINMTVFYYNESSESWETLNSENVSTNTGANLNYTTMNVTGKYGLMCSFKREGYSDYTFGIPYDDFDNILIYHIWNYSEVSNDIDDTVTNTIGRSPVHIGETIVAYTSLITLFIAMVGLFTFSPKFSGFCVVLIGLVIGAFKEPLGIIGNDAITWTAVAIIILLGIFMIIVLKKED